jgi:hypothetical protein
LSSDCATLRDGKLYGCYKPYCVKFLNDCFKQDFKLVEKDFKDIYNVKDMDELLDFEHNPIPFCRYCDVSNIKSGIVWKASKKDINEWV